MKSAKKKILFTLLCLSSASFANPFPATYARQAQNDGIGMTHAPVSAPNTRMRVNATLQPTHGKYSNGRVINRYWTVDGQKVSEGATYRLTNKDIGKKVIFVEEVENLKTGQVVRVQARGVDAVSMGYPSQHAAPEILQADQLKPGSVLNNRRMGKYNVSGKMVGDGYDGTDAYFPKTTWYVDGEDVQWGYTLTAADVGKTVYYEETVINPQTDEKATFISQKVIVGGGTAAPVPPGNPEPPPAPQPPRVNTPGIVPAVEGGYAWHSSEYARLWGPGLGVLSQLHNLQIGSRTVEMTAFRFRALHAGRVQSLRLYWQGNRAASGNTPEGSGYAAGDGGRYRIRIVRDDGRGNPDMQGAPLAEFFYTPGNRFGQKFDLINGGSAGSPLEKNGLYYVVMQNIHPDAQQNFMSVNSAATFRVGRGLPMRWLSPGDWATLYKAPNAGEWRNAALHGTGSGRSNDDHMMPIMQITLQGGQSWGNTDMESGARVGQTLLVASASHPVREEIVPQADRRVRAFSVATSTPTGGSLHWALQDAGGQVIREGVIREGAPNRIAPHNNLIAPKWYDIDLQQEVLLKANTRTYLVFTPEGGSEWDFAASASGTNWQFSAPAAWAESQAQHLLYGSWVYFNRNNHNARNARTQDNWPVVFHLSP